MSALSPENWPFDLEFLPPPAYLVGGAVRDALLGREVADLDLDFVLLSGAVKTARTIASYYKAGFVLLDAERQIARVVFDGVTADFAEASGGSLQADLGRRDFTINAIAYDPILQEAIDPHGGQGDLKLGLMRMISRENLADDPLRLLRGYRQAAQLGFAIEEKTRRAIAELASLLERVAAERIRTELGYLLNTPRGVSGLIEAWNVGLISRWFPDADKGCDRLLNLDDMASQLSKFDERLGAELGESVRETLKMSRLAIAKLATLVSPEPETAETQLLELKYSRAEIRGVLAILRGLETIQNTPIPQLSIREQYFLFQTVGSFFAAFVAAGMAVGVPLEVFSPLVERYLTPKDAIAHPTPPVGGKVLMKELGIPPSPVVGDLLLEVQLAQAEGKIATPEDAIAIAAQKLKEWNL
ncbi:MAG: CCA tRNA nucleotidyltransferase [Limnospira sp.]